MTYTDLEQSIDSGNPVELYQFQVGPDFYYFTSADHDITYNSILYRSDYIQRDAISQSREEARDRPTIRVGKNNAVADLFKQQPPFYEIFIQILRYHLNDPDAPDVRTIFRGKVLDASWPDGVTVAHLECESLFASLKTEGMRWRYQGRCNHTIYTEDCGLNFQTLKEDFVVAAISSDGKTITLTGLSSQPANRYKGGLLRFGTDVWVMVVRHTGNDAELFRAIPQLVVGATVSLGRACRNLRDQCIALGNYENYLGWPDVPEVNIFTGDGLRSQR
jgi:hypothetical protein